MLSFSQFNEHIEKVGNKFRLVSKSSGKNLGTYSTKVGAEKREKQVQYFKNNESANSFDTANYNDGDEGLIGSLFRKMSIDTPLQPTVEDLGKDPGMYSYFGLTDESAEALYNWSKKVGIPNPVTPDKLHSTCIFSPRSFQNYNIQEEPFVINPDDYSLGILGHQNESALVLKYKSDVAESQWAQAKKLGALSSFPSYIPHITLSYDPQNFDYSKIKAFNKPLKFKKEFVQALNKKDLTEAYNNYQFEKVNWTDFVDKAKETIHNWVKDGEGREHMTRLAKLTQKEPELRKFHPGPITVFRGENEDSKKSNEMGTSFSKSKEIANKYAGEDGKIVKKEISKTTPAIDVNKLLDIKSKIKDKEVFVAQP